MDIYNLISKFMSCFSEDIETMGGSIEQAEASLYRYRGQTHYLDTAIAISLYLIENGRDQERAYACLTDAMFHKAYCGGMDYKKIPLIKSYHFVCEGLSRFPDSPDLAAIKSMFLLNIGSSMEVTSSQDPSSNWRELFALGVCYALELEHEKAESILLRAFFYAPELKKPFIINHIGVVLDCLGQGERSAQYYKHAIALDPDFAWPFYNLGLHAEDVGDVSLAKEYSQEALSRMDFEYANDLYDRTNE
ncbi:tetratricopeptide repeat protein [Hahella sp. CCB-MM4]|uniref:tetratricopeptide repeat protein n=1 Tax=Hahella sp. (strain CCB-MM4) TaxID=1926491 RepID=UPI0011407D1A|nr:hypothetical protein [Hahella sp. CCB-MM4]